MPRPPLRVTVPASSANLGGAFDTAAVALGLHLSVLAVPTEGRDFTVSYRGPSPESVPRDASNLVCRAIAEVLAQRGEGAPGLAIEVTSEIPLGVGLGSSAAALVAGSLIGGQLAAEAPTVAELLRVAAALEGHPDNAAAALLGGFVVAANGPEGVIAHRADVPEDLRFVVASPAGQLPTDISRSVLPDRYPREDVVWNLQRVALLTAAFFEGRGELRPELFQDRLHQPQRASLVPGLSACLELAHPDLLGVFLSGAGPSVVAVCRRSAEELGELLGRTLAGAGVTAGVRRLGADNQGALGRLG